LLEDFIKKISSRTGRTISERENEYLLVLTSLGDENIVICVREGDYGFYAKVILERDLAIINCSEAEYSPLGLYIFSRSIDELVDKTYAKILYLVSKSKISPT
jgi:hypothetical protein